MSKNVFTRFSVITKNTNFEEVLKKSPEILKSHGFGVLYDLDMKQILKQKINVDTHNRRILGVCNPKSAHSIIEIDTNFGTFAPCGLYFEQKNETDGVSITLNDPEETVAPFLNSDVMPDLKKAGNGLDAVFKDFKTL
jgi:uncharacterized protein (DUF302 family)